MYEIGDRFTYTGTHNGELWTETYILAQVDAFKAALICLENGNRWQNPVSIEDPSKITEKEWKNISFCSEDESFTKVEVAENV